MKRKVRETQASMKINFISVIAESYYFTNLNPNCIILSIKKFNKSVGNVPTDIGNILTDISENHGQGSTFATIVPSGQHFLLNST
jgi:hypothetical protein